MRKRTFLWRAAGTFAALVALALVVLLVDGWRAFGRRASGARRERMERSHQWQKSAFENPQPMVNSLWGAINGALHISPYATPDRPVPTEVVDPHRFAQPPTTGLRITWLGHSTLLIEIDGQRILTDPVWSERASPFGWTGPRRWFPPPLAIADLPHIDAVVISHDHYDHLDYTTISALKALSVTFIVPIGVGAHLGYWGVSDAHIVELDWWERTHVGALEIVCAPARHASGRMLFDDNAKLWASYALIGPAHRAYYSGDTGLFPALHDIGERLGPFDVTMIEVGQYGAAWPDWHLGPEQAVVAHQMVHGRVMMPIHWGTFALAYHAWTEPVERTLAAATASRVPLVVPKPGQSIEPEAPPPLDRWWPDVPWKTGAEDPIVAGKMH